MTSNIIISSSCNSGFTFITSHSGLTGFFSLTLSEPSYSTVDTFYLLYWLFLTMEESPTAPLFMNFCDSKTVNRKIIVNESELALKVHTTWTTLPSLKAYLGWTLPFLWYHICSSFPLLLFFRSMKFLRPPHTQVGSLAGCGSAMKASLFLICIPYIYISLFISVPALVPTLNFLVFFLFLSSNCTFYISFCPLFLFSCKSA